MILSDRMIREAMEAGDIVIEPFDSKRLGTNSYDVTLGNELLVYEREMVYVPWAAKAGFIAGPGRPVRAIDARKQNDTKTIIIPDGGIVLEPGELYLAVTNEYTETYRYVPFLDGKSSIGRLGIFVHCTAGRGDVGFCNHWTLEIMVVVPVRVYAGMPIGQLTYHVTGEVDVPYDKKMTAKYNGKNPHPMPSQMWKNFLTKEEDGSAREGEATHQSSGRRER